MGSEAPKRKERQSSKAVSVEPPIQIVFSKPYIIEPTPQKVEEVTIPPPKANPGPVLGLAKKKPVSESPASAKSVHSPVTIADSAHEYLKSLAWEEMVWGIAVAVSWTVTVVALLRLAGVV